MMKTYDSYKDSGIEWIGEIPRHWECKRLGMIGLFSSSGIDKKIVENEPLVKMVNYTDIIKSRKHNPIISDNTEFMVVSSPESKIHEHTLQRGDLVFIPSSETDIDLGLSSIIDVDNIVFSYHVIRFQFLSDIYHGYKRYFTNHHGVLKQFSSEGKGTTRQIIGRNVFRNICVTLPPLSEQEQIVSYLDEKTSLIDEMVEKKKRKIELLKEYRTSLINTVVTKGLNPDVPMKDSGIGWIGEIPRHWVVKPIKYTVSENQVSLGSNTDDNYELDYVEISDIDSSGRIINKTNYKFIDSPSRCRRVLSKGDVFISTVRTYLRSIGIVETEVRNLICSTGFSVLSPKRNILSRYLFYSVSSEWFISKVVSQSEGVSYPSIQSDKLLSISLTLPPLSEQEQIVSYLDEKRSEIDKTIELENKKIELLKEYRQSLISNVVTGKIKVVSE